MNDEGTKLDEDVIEINPDAIDRIQLLIKNADIRKPRPFKNVQQFVDKAVEVWLAWEEDPNSVIEIMNSYRQTEAQKALMQKLMRAEKISVKDGQVTIIDEEPGNVGISVWIDRTKRIQQLIKNADKPRPFRTVQQFVDKAVDVWLAWEEDPKSVIEIFNRYRKTEAQDQKMQELMRAEKISVKGGQVTIMDEEPGNVDPDATLSFLDELGFEGHRKLTSIRDKLEKTKKYIEEKKVFDPNTIAEGYRNEVSLRLGKYHPELQYYSNYEITEVYSYESFEDEFPLLWRYYSRIFPAKVIITLLANMMYDQKNDYVKLSDLQTEGLKVCLAMSQEIEKYEKNNKIKKTDKISTGFPNHTITEDNTGKLDHIKQQTKHDEINQRFQDRFIGKVENKFEERKFAGILSALGIVKCVAIDTETPAAFTDEKGRAAFGPREPEDFITLTESGKKFFLLSNLLIEKPIGGKSNKITPFSDEEVDLIMKEMFEQRKLEKMIIDLILKKMDPGKWYDADTITSWMKDEIQEFVDEKEKEWHDSVQGKLFDTELKNYEKIQAKQKKNVGEKLGVSRISSWRAATMGRLSELRKINWQINSNGKSEYSLNQD